MLAITMCIIVKCRSFRVLTKALFARDSHFLVDLNQEVTIVHVEQRKNFPCQFSLLLHLLHGSSYIWMAVFIFHNIFLTNKE